MQGNIFSLPKILLLVRFFCRGSDYGCIGEKFFEGLINFTFMKKMKRRLQETVEHYKQNTESDEAEGETKNALNEKLLK